MHSRHARYAKLSSSPPSPREAQRRQQGSSSPASPTVSERSGTETPPVEVSHRTRRVTFATLASYDRCGVDHSAHPSDSSRGSEGSPAGPERSWLEDVVLDESHFPRPRRLMTTGLPTQNFVFKTGIAMKQGALVKNWKQRLLILDGASLRYYQPVDKGWPRGTIPLALILGVLEVGNELLVQTPKRTYRIRAPNCDARRQWLRAITHNLAILQRNLRPHCD